MLGVPALEYRSDIADEDDVDRKSTRSELQSHLNLVCRLLLEKKKKETQRSEDEISNYSVGTMRTAALSLARHVLLLSVPQALSLCAAGDVTQGTTSGTDHSA